MKDGGGSEKRVGERNARKGCEVVEVGVMNEEFGECGRFIDKRKDNRTIELNEERMSVDVLYSKVMMFFFAARLHHRRS